MEDDTGRREARRFEPPPWERERFEVHETRCEQHQEPEDEPREGEPDADEGEGHSREPRSSVEEPAGRLAEDRVAVMLAELRAEEPPAGRELRTPALFASGLTAFLGLSMVAWAGVAFLKARGGLASVTGALIILSMGALFAAMGAWLMLKIVKREE